MKQGGAIDDTDLQNRFARAITDTFSEAGIKATLERLGPVDSRRYRPDMLLTLRAGKREYRFAVEIKSIGQPRNIRLAAQELTEYLAAGKDPDYGILAAPYISEEGRRLCQRYDIGCIDLAGNARVVFNGLYIDIQGRKNPYPTTRGAKSLFTRKSSRAIRVLLADPSRLWLVQDLAREANLSMGQTSNVKRLLAEEDLLREEGKSFSIAEPQRLLDAWAQAYSFEQNRIYDFYTTEGTGIEPKIASFCKEAGIRYGLALFSGANLVAPFVRYGKSFVYVQANSTPDIARELDLKAVSSGPNIALVEPYDEGVFYGTRQIEGLDVVSDVQLYLDLNDYPTRGQEAAEQVLERRIRPAWQ